MRFEDLPGLEEVKATLRRSVARNHVAHAQLFDGPPGGGGLALALAFATYLNCENRQPDDACGTCASCVKMNGMVHPDLHQIFPLPRSPKPGEELLAELTPPWREFVRESPYRTLTEWLAFIKATNNQQGIIPIREARAIVSKLSLKAFEGQYKIMVLWQVELLNLSAANALLKVLEEPPGKTVFLLVTEDADQLLTTLLSRAQRLVVPAFGDAEVAAFLQRNYRLDERKARRIAYLCDGNLSVARQLLTDEDTRNDWFSDWMRLCFRQDLAALVKRADQFDGMSKGSQKDALDYALRQFRETLLWSQGAGGLLRVPEEELTFVQNFARAVPQESMEPMIAEINEAYYHIERNVRAKMVFLDLSLTMARLFQKPI